jgi:hypothetical protein
MEEILPKTATFAQSFAKAVSINDLNYIMLKRRDGSGKMPPLSLKRVFCVFAMLDKFLGGDGLLSEKSQLWVGDDADTSSEILDEIIASTRPMQEARREKWTIAVFSETFFSDDPRDSVEVEKVKKCCRLLTGKHKKLVIGANFLHKYEGRVGYFFTA